MTIRDPAPNVGVPSVAPRRQRGLPSAETEVCSAAAFLAVWEIARLEDVKP